MIPPLSVSGQLLWRLLPRVYRERDGVGGVDPKRPTKPRTARGDLANYLDAFGLLLDELRGTLEARRLDSLPEHCQPWLIPYFADLIDVRLVSPDVEGQREEVARAVSWRKRKGTLGCIAEVAQRVGRLERTVFRRNPSGPEHISALPTVLVQEGFRRVLTTVTIGAPLLTPSELGLSATPAPSPSPVEAAKNPALPRGTLDFRRLSLARRAQTLTLATREYAFSDPATAQGVGERWYQSSLHGVPCRQDTYQDASARTVDMRTPTHRTGLYHPRRVLLWAEPRAGFFSPEAHTLDWEKLALLVRGEHGVEETRSEVVAGSLVQSAHFAGEAASPAPGFCMLEADLERRDGTRVRTRTAGRLARDGEWPVREERVGGRSFAFVAGFDVIDEYAAHDSPEPARRVIRGFGAEPPRLRPAANGSYELGRLDGDPASHALEQLVALGTLQAARPLAVVRAAVERVGFGAPASETGAASPEEPGLDAVDALFAEVAAADEHCRFECCTVLGSTACKKLEASDSILTRAEADAFDELWLRYSCVPWLPRGELPAARGRVHEPSLTRAQPLFLEDRFGKPGAGVLHPGCNAAVREGAEDGGELGAFHHRHHVRRERALLDKLREFLPVTLEPALIPHRPWVIPVA